MPEWSPQVFVSWDDEQAHRISEVLHGVQSRLRAVTVRAAREHLKLQGRGVMVAIFNKPTLDTLRPPIYYPLVTWEQQPLFPQFELLRHMREYDTDRQFIQLALGPDPRRDFVRIGRYAYWIVELAESEMQS